MGTAQVKSIKLKNAFGKNTQLLNKYKFQCILSLKLTILWKGNYLLSTFTKKKKDIRVK